MWEALIVGIIKLVIEEAPAAVPVIRTLLTKDNPTDADYDTAKAGIKAATYAKLVPNSQLPPR